MQTANNDPAIIETPKVVGNITITKKANELGLHAVVIIIDYLNNPIPQNPAIDFQGWQLTPKGINNNWPSQQNQGLSDITPANDQPPVGVKYNGIISNFSAHGSGYGVMYKAFVYLEGQIINDSERAPVDMI